MVDMPKGSQAPRRRPSLRGVLMQDIAFGKERVRAWPTPRGPAKTKALKESRDKFALVQKMAAYLAPGVLAYIHKAVDNSPLLPRDVVTMMLYNRWMAFDLEDGRTIWPMTARTDVSEALDILTKEVGDYLVRTSAGWRGASTLPMQPTRVKQAAAYLSAPMQTAPGFRDRVPFNVINGDPGGWWQAGTSFSWKPDVPGFYMLELRISKTTESITAAWVKTGDLSKILLSGWDENASRAAVTVGMLYLDGLSAVTSSCWNTGSSTIEANGAQGSYFKITGPF